jgi:hypothetical protein
MGPPSLEDAAKEASMAPYLIGSGGVGGIFLAGLILGAFITYLVVEKVGLSRRMAMSRILATHINGLCGRIFGRRLRADRHLV